MTVRGRPLRVAFVVDTINGRLGGGVAVARSVVARLREQGMEVRVIASDADGPTDLRLPAFQLPLRAMRRMEFFMARPERGKIEALFGEVDVVHLQLPFWLSFTALDVARQLGLPVVSAFHVQPENALRSIGIEAGWLRDWLYRQWVTRLYDRTDVVVCPTRFAERKLRAYGLRVPTRVISNGIPPDLGSGAPAPVRESAHVGVFVILSAGRFAAEKRPDVLIEAVNRSRHRDRIKLVLAGAGPLEKKLLRQAAALPLGAEIGFLPRARLANLFSTADLFVHCGEVELEGIAVIEAMSRGLPVVVAESSESAASELALDGDFSFPAGDVTALASRIDALIDAPERLAQAGERYRVAARALDFDESVRSLSELYRSVTGDEAANPTS